MRTRTSETDLGTPPLRAGSAPNTTAQPARKGRASLLGLQRAAGNRAVGRVLARDALPIDAIDHTGARFGLLVDDDATGTLYEKPDATGKAVGTLPHDKSFPILGSAGPFLIVVFEGRRLYVDRKGIAEVTDLPTDQLKADWVKRLKAMNDKLDAAGHPAPASSKYAPTGGQAPVSSGPHAAFPPEFMSLEERLSASTTWDDALEEAQHLLADYVRFYWDSYQAMDMPANVKDFLGYIGRGSKNFASAEKGKYPSAGKLGGAVGAGGKATSNWCTQATSQAVLDAVGGMGQKLSIEEIQKRVSGAKGFFQGGAAYAAPLMPGDMVMYLFDGCQYGGHTVTVIDDLGDSFTHVSGNSTNGAVMVGEAKRLAKPPASFDLAKACPGPVFVKDEKGNPVLDKAATQKAHAEASAYIATLSFGGGVLVYSIVRYGSFLAGLSTPKPTKATSTP